MSEIKARVSIVRKGPGSNLVRKKIWLLEDDDEYRDALATGIREKGADVSDYGFVGSLYKDLVKWGNYPDALIIDLLNPPTLLRGHNNFLVSMARWSKRLLSPLYLEKVFEPGAQRLKKKLDAAMLNPDEFQTLNYDEILCWPWGGLQLLAILADPKLIPLDGERKNGPRIIVNSIMDVVSESIWNLGKVPEVILSEFIPRVDELLTKKFGPAKHGAMRPGGCLAYVAKGDLTTDDVVDPYSPDAVSMESDVAAVLAKISEVIDESPSTQEE
jgi:hypothetical protein